MEKIISHSRQSKMQSGWTCRMSVGIWRAQMTDIVEPGFWIRQLGIFCVCFYFAILISRGFSSPGSFLRHVCFCFLYELGMFICFAESPQGDSGAANSPCVPHPTLVEDWITRLNVSRAGLPTLFREVSFTTFSFILPFATLRAMLTLSLGGTVCA